MTFDKIIFAAVTVFMFAIGGTSVAAEDKHEKRTLIMDIQITGDSSVEGDKEDNILKINNFSEYLRAELQSKTAFVVVNNSPALKDITTFQQEENVLNCNGCEQALAEKYNAELVMVPYVFRMSHLISTLHIEIKDVESGNVIKKKAFDFRGNTDKAWERAIQYAVRDLADWQP